MKQIVQVLGPTGVGKSSIAIQIAAAFNGEIISADSAQVYKHFDIGTDKLPSNEQLGVPHHLIDILDDCSQFNASMFMEASFTLAEDLHRRYKLPIICGGTALYLKTMINGIFPENPNKRINRDHLNRIVDRIGLEKLYQKLMQVDPQYGAKIGTNDRVRIVRAMEIYYNNGLPPSEIFKQTISPFSPYRFIRIGLNMQRDLLYSRIEKRVDRMMERGLVEEVRRLKELYPPTCPPFKSLGYKEVLMYLNGQISSLEETVSLIKQHSRNFAKRQLSWFRQEEDISWFDPADGLKIQNFLTQQLM